MRYCVRFPVTQYPSATGAPSKALKVRPPAAKHYQLRHSCTLPNSLGRAPIYLLSRRSMLARKILLHNYGLWMLVKSFIKQLHNRVNKPLSAPASPGCVSIVNLESDNSKQMSGLTCWGGTIYPFFNCRKLVSYNNDNDDNDCVLQRS